MSAAENEAVFLSYASQDATAVVRIAEELRAAGIEVWFDQDELAGGDAWDQKIRGQVKSCALFVPVISAATQARREGYFRIEWKLAAQRTHAFADGTPFLLPVVIDATKDGEALVPEEFRAVQWTRLMEGEKGAVGKFCARVGKLLGGAEAEAGRSRGGERGEGAALPIPEPPKVGRRVPAAAWIVAGVVVGGGALYWGMQPATDAGAGTRPPTTETASTAAAWPRDPELRRALALVNGTEANSEDFALAEEIAKKALAKNATDPEAVTVMARVQVSYLFRGFDRGDERRAAARRYAERAVQLAPKEPEALAALGVFYFQHESNWDLARELLDKAIELRPDEPYYYRHRDNSLFLDARVPTAEAIASAEKTAARFPRDALAQYELARHYRDLGRIEECERAIDRALAIAPLANAIGWKARIALGVRGDFAEAKALLDRIPPRMRSLERVVLSRWILAMAGTDREGGVEALQSLTNAWVEDFNYVGPKSLLMAALLDASGKRESARLHYEAALTEIRSRQAREPANRWLPYTEAGALLGLGRLDEARVANRVVMESVPHPYRYDPFDMWWFNSIPRCLLLGEREAALQLLREAAAGEIGNQSGRVQTGSSVVSARAALRMAMKQDARMAPFCDDPEIVALLADSAPMPEGKKTTATGALPSEAAQLTARALAAFTKVGFMREDLVAAEDFARRATELEPASAVAWGVRAGVQSAWIFRNWDSGDKRRQDTQAHANRALALDPDESEALLALAIVLRRQGALEQAVALLRRASAAHPDHIRLGRQLGFTLSSQGNDEEARIVLRALTARYPRDPLLRYDLATCLASYGPGGSSPQLLAGALEEIDAALAIQPFSSALVLKAVLLGGWRGDLAASRAVMAQLEKMPLGDLTEDRAVFMAMWLGLLEQRSDRVEEAAALTARSYFEDSLVMLRPKAWSLALAHQVAGKENTARADWQAAEAMLRQRLKDEPGNQIYQVELAATLAWLGQREEALRLVEPVEAVWKEGLNWGRSRLLALAYAALGDAARAGPYLPLVVDRSPFTSRHLIQRDPWWDKIRGAPEFEAALKAAEAKARVEKGK